MSYIEGVDCTTRAHVVVGVDVAAAVAGVRAVVAALAAAAAAELYFGELGTRSDELTRELPQQHWNCGCSTASKLRLCRDEV